MKAEIYIEEARRTVGGLFASCFTMREDNRALHVHYLFIPPIEIEGAWTPSECARRVQSYLFQGAGVLGQMYMSTTRGLPAASNH